MIDPNNDGWDHINIYNKAGTKLGRWLSNFTKEPFNCEDGNFNSIEGYWYWLSCKNDKLRELHGFEAKKIGRELGACDWLDTEEFKNKIKKAMEFKLETNLEMKKEFKNSNLPFEHYYSYGGKVIDVKEGKWIIEHWEYLRKLDDKSKN